MLREILANYAKTSSQGNGQEHDVSSDTVSTGESFTSNQHSSPRKSISFEDQTTDPNLANLRDIRVLQQKEARSVLSYFVAKHAELVSLVDLNPNKQIFILLKSIKKNLDSLDESQVQYFIQHEITGIMKKILDILISTNAIEKDNPVYSDDEKIAKNYLRLIIEVANLLDKAASSSPLIFSQAIAAPMLGETLDNHNHNYDYFALNSNDDVDIFAPPVAIKTAVAEKTKKRNPEDSCFDRIKMLFCG